MKVLQINCVYGKGSTGYIVQSLHKEYLKRGTESVVLYGRGEKTDEKNVYKVCSEAYAKINNLFSRISGFVYGGCFLSTRKILKIIKKENPSVVHLHCLNGYFVNVYNLVEKLKERKIKTVVTLHAEFMYTANCGHSLTCEKWTTGCGNCPRLKTETKSLFFDNTHKSWLKMKAAFDGFDNGNLTIASVSPWVKSRAERSPILKDKRNEVIYNCVDTSVFRLRNADELRLRKGYGNEKIVFHATTILRDDKNDLKGGYYVLRLAEKMRAENVKFIIAGDYEKGLKTPENVILLGKIADRNVLAEYYSIADVTLLTSKRETFSMVTAESLCAGTPVVGFGAGAPEQIATSDCVFVENGNEEELFEALKKALGEKYDKIAMSEKAGKLYGVSKIADKYIDIYRGFFGKTDT